VPELAFLSFQKNKTSICQRGQVFQLLHEIVVLVKQAVPFASLEALAPGNAGG
jgi:hypothetical protein